jgi:hypothetical protein
MKQFAILLFFIAVTFTTKAQQFKRDRDSMVHYFCLIHCYESDIKPNADTSSFKTLLNSYDMYRRRCLRVLHSDSAVENKFLNSIVRSLDSCKCTD